MPKLYRPSASSDLMDTSSHKKALPAGHRESAASASRNVVALLRPSSSLQELGERLRELRKEKTYSLEAVSRLSGVSKSMISKIERRQATPSTTVLARIAE